MLRAVRDWFDNMDRKIDNAAQTMLSGGLTPDQSRAATTIEWLLRYGLYPSELPDRLTRQLPEDRLHTIIQRYYPYHNDNDMPS